MARGPSDQLVGPSEMILHSKKEPGFSGRAPTAQQHTANELD